MSEYQESIVIRSSPSEVFRFLSSVDNITSYLPMIREVRTESGDRIRALAEPAKQQREISGYFRVVDETRSIEWGIDGTPVYQGRLEVQEDAGRTSALRVRLTMERRQDDQHVRQTLRQVMQSIKRLVEEQGGGRVAGGGAA